MQTTKTIMGCEVTEDEGGIYIDKVKYHPFTGGALKLGNSFGYMYPWEILTLQVFVRSLPLNAIVINIGAGAGTSGLAMAEARIDLIPNIYTIDIKEDGGPFGGLLPERNAFGQYNTPLVHQILGDSYDVGLAWDRGPVDLVFVDGNHTLDGVARDIQAWLPRVRDNGFMLFHDFNHGMYKDLKPTVEKMMAAHEQIAVVDLLAVYRVHKPAKKSRKAKAEG